MTWRLLIERLADLGARPEDTQHERHRAGALILASVLISLLSFVWVVTYLGFGYSISAAIPAFYQVATLGGLIVLSRTRRFEVFRTTQLLLFLLLPAVLQVSLGGFVASSGVVLWSMVTPLAALAMLGIRRAVPWLVGFGLMLLVLALLDPIASGDPADLPADIQTAFFVLNIAGTMIAAFMLLGYFVHQRELAQAALALEQERSERLLLNVLPGSIAERLKTSEDVIAESFPHVSVLFADLVGFSPMSAAMDAVDVVSLLNEVFTAFDELAEAGRLEKIKTIGDAYMVAGGLPQPRPDHVAAVARMALGMHERLGELAANRSMGDRLTLRVGIDAGPVVAGVIGRRKFIYDLWGDTVNTASRMESHGVPGRTQVTERVARELEPTFLVVPRGTIEIKGKEPMSTFFLEGERSQHIPTERLSSSGEMLPQQTRSASSSEQA